MGNTESREVGDLSFDVNTPPTPFHQQTPGGLQIGKTMFIEGETRSGKSGSSDRFTINLELADKDNVALHYDVRFWRDAFAKGQTAIVMNSRHRGKWQKEERIANYFVKDQPFRIDVQLTADAFVITHNSGAAFSFPYRNKTMPDKIQKITIEGNIRIRRIFYGHPHAATMPAVVHHEPPPAYSQMPGFTSGSVGPTPPNPSYQTPGFTAHPMDTNAITTPGFTGPAGATSATPPSAHVTLTDAKLVHGGMHAGRQVVVQGMATDGAQRFTVDLNDLAGNTVLHISSRFDERAIVRNSQQSGVWGAEERQSSSAFPFQLGQPFQVQILCEPTMYRIAINGEHYADFQHRADPITVQSVNVTGELNFVDVQVY